MIFVVKPQIGQLIFISLLLIGISFALSFIISYLLLLLFDLVLFIFLFRKHYITIYFYEDEFRIVKFHKKKSIVIPYSSIKEIKFYNFSYKSPRSVLIKYSSYKRMESISFSQYNQMKLLHILSDKGVNIIVNNGDGKWVSMNN
jgi:hypothetical protein